MILDVDETGVAAKFQSQAFKVARFLAREKVEAAEVGDEEVDPLKERLLTGGLELGNQQEPVGVAGSMDVDEEDGIDAAETGLPESDFGLKPGAMPAPDSPSLSEQLPSPKSPVGRHPDLGPSHDKLCEASQPPKVNRTQYDEITRDQLHDERSQRGFRGKESEAVWKTR